MPMPPPTIGRIVHYRVSAEELKPRAAMVIDVHEPYGGSGLVDLAIFPRGREQPVGELVPACVLTVHRVARGTRVGEWSWPPRVG